MKKHKTIRILPFRVYEGHLEILLLKHIQKLKAFNEDINAIELFSDPSPIFSAARIFSEIFLGMKWNLDEKVSINIKEINKF